jgi:hypothetical protein
MDDARGSQSDIEIAKGKTFSRVLRLGGKPYQYKAISAIAKTAPARLTVTGHGIPADWPVAVVSVQGMTEINAETSPPLASDYMPATVVNANTIDLNDVNASGFSTYTGGGYLQMYTPTSLAGAIVRLTIRDVEGGTALITLSSATSGIVLDDVAKTITITISAAVTAAIDWLTGVYDAEIQLADGTVEPLLYGSVSVLSEITT